MSLGGVVFANAYFVDNGVAWQILNPLGLLTVLVWAAVAGPVSLRSSKYV